MKRDCPHCHKSLAQRFLRWSKIGQLDHMRACPICGKEIEFRLHAEEIGVRVLAIAVVIGACYAAKDRGGGYFGIVATAAAIIAIAYLAAYLRLRDAQRFRKGRND